MLLSESPEFVSYLRRFTGAQALAAFANRWSKDPRTWAREQVRSYTVLPMDQAGHEPVVKRLFKAAEGARDHQAMGWWAVAFDRLAQRQRRNQWHWDRGAQEAYQTLELYTPLNRVVPNPSVPDAKPKRRRGKTYRLFTYATRHYLRRRAWRYFRNLGYSQPEAYVQAVAQMLAGYRDEDLELPENILDARTLMHVCFHESPVLSFSPRFVQLAESASMGELKPAPYHDELWREDSAFAPLMELLGSCESTVVRVFALGLIEEFHATKVPDLPPEQVMGLMTHSDPRVQEFATKAFVDNRHLTSLGIDVWLRLLGQPESPILSTIVLAFEKHVDSGRLDLAQRFALLHAQPVPVATLGFKLVKEWLASKDSTRENLAEVAAVRSIAVAREACDWAIDQEAGLSGSLLERIDFISAFFDALLLPVRAAALAGFTPDSPLWNEPELWARLVESPHDDVRFAVLEGLDERGSVPGSKSTELDHVWKSVILGVTRGSRWKPRALQQIVDALVADPTQDKADGLIAVLTIAVRSVRTPERLAGLAAIARLCHETPDLTDRVRQALPEMELDLPVETLPQ